MLTLPTRNIIFAAGESACSPNGYYDEICLAGVNRDQGVLSNVIAWTVDKESSFEKYFKLGARGIITNRVPDLLRWVLSCSTACIKCLLRNLSYFFLSKISGFLTWFPSQFICYAIEIKFAACVKLETLYKYNASDNFIVTYDVT